MIVTIQEADEYFKLRPFCEDWFLLSDTDKTKFLSFASSKIERLPFVGEKMSIDQTTLFPRIIRASTGQGTFLPQDMKNFLGQYVIINDIPQEVKLAVFEEAWAIYEYMNGEIYKLREQGVQRGTRGGLSENFETYRPMEELLSPLAKYYLRDWIAWGARL